MNGYKSLLLLLYYEKKSDKLNFILQIFINKILIRKLYKNYDDLLNLKSFISTFLLVLSKK